MAKSLVRRKTAGPNGGTKKSTAASRAKEKLNEIFRREPNMTAAHAGRIMSGEAPMPRDPTGKIVRKKK